MSFQLGDKSQELYDDSIENSDSYGGNVGEVPVYGWICDFYLEVLEEILDDSSN